MQAVGASNNGVGWVLLGRPILFSYRVSKQNGNRRSTEQEGCGVGVMLWLG